MLSDEFFGYLFSPSPSLFKNISYQMYLQCSVGCESCQILVHVQRRIDQNIYKTLLLLLFFPPVLTVLWQSKKNTRKKASTLYCVPYDTGTLIIWLLFFSSLHVCCVLLSTYAEQKSETKSKRKERERDVQIERREKKNKNCEWNIICNLRCFQKCNSISNE